VNNLMIPGKGIRGILGGESVPDIFIPQLWKVLVVRTGK
jgi:aryl-alcohol dehydrogenase